MHKIIVREQVSRQRKESPMKSSRLVAVTASAMLALSTVTAGAGMPAPPPSTHSGHLNATPFWIIFGCAGSIIFTAYVAHVQRHRQLTQQEAMTCGLLYWFNPHP
jgi:integral membrane sensor domain MASE1